MAFWVLRSQALEGGQSPAVEIGVLPWRAGSWIKVWPGMEVWAPGLKSVPWMCVKALDGRQGPRMEVQVLPWKKGGPAVKVWASNWGLIQEMPGPRWQMPSRALGTPWRHLLEEDFTLSMFNLLHRNFLNCLGDILRVLEVHVQLGYSQANWDYYL